MFIIRSIKEGITYIICGYLLYLDIEQRDIEKFFFRDGIELNYE